MARLILLITISLICCLWYPYLLNTDGYQQCISKCKESKTTCITKKYDIVLKMEEYQLEYGQALHEARIKTYYHLHSKRFPKIEYKCRSIEPNNTICYHNGKSFPSRECICGSIIYKDDAAISTLGIFMLGFSSFFYAVTGDCPTF